MTTPVPPSTLRPTSSERLLAAPGQARRCPGAVDQLPSPPDEGDPSLVVGWAGWDQLQRAQALVAYYDALGGWTPTDSLAGLDRLLPWIHQWHPRSARFGDTAGQSLPGLPEERAPTSWADPGRHPQLAAPRRRPATGSRRWTASTSCSPRAGPQGDCLGLSQRGAVSRTVSRYRAPPSGLTLKLHPPGSRGDQLVERATCTAASVPASRIPWPSCT